MDNESVTANLQINPFFMRILFGKLKKVTIFATAFALRLAQGDGCTTYWRNGRVVDCGSLENC